jgi:hypothetical protein
MRGSILRLSFGLGFDIFDCGPASTIQTHDSLARDAEFEHDIRDEVFREIATIPVKYHFTNSFLFEKSSKS